MKSFYINPDTGDLEFDGQNSLKMVNGDDELTQSVSLSLKTNKGEWFLDPDLGFDRSVVQQKRYNEAMVNDALYETILYDERVASVDDVTFDFDAANRKLAIDFKFKKVDGTTIEGSVK